ncbi:hypothetical protein [Sphingomonas sp.]|uniref:hypothetical protein n=1 Tax=Sphingomonas sp. TaxID=28214 RepID=UPI00258B262A|nr:hypothetical protein [Sphingomonas sp.]
MIEGFSRSKGLRAYRRDHGQADAVDAGDVAPLQAGVGQGAEADAIARGSAEASAPRAAGVAAPPPPVIVSAPPRG